MNQLDTTMIYSSIRSAQHVSGNILPTIRSVRLRYLQHMVQCPVVVVGRETVSGSVALIQVNQLDATMIYSSIRSAQHVSGNILPIIRSLRLRYLQHMVFCCCGGQGDGERQRGTNTDEPTGCKNDLFIYKISSTCFG